MSTIRHYLNNSFPQPILDVDVSSINTSDTNNYLFDYSKITADDTFEIIEASVCYINGQENTSITAASLRGKRTTVAIVGDSGVTNSSKYIGCVSPGSASDGSNGSSTFKFYKFMAFKEKLTKEQINKVMDKYGFYKGE